MSVANRKRKPKKNVPLRGETDMEVVRRVLTFMGAWDVYSQSDRHIRRELLVNWRFPRLAVVLDDDLVHDKEAKRLRSRLQKSLKALPMDVAPFNGGCSVQEYVSIARGLAHLHNVPVEGDESAKSQVQAIVEACQLALSRDVVEGLAFSLFRWSDSQLSNVNTVDEQQFYLTYRAAKRTARGAPLQELVLHRATPEKKYLEVEGQEGKHPCLCYPCKLHCGLGPLEHIIWTEEDAGAIGLDAEHPVYVSKHTLQQIDKRTEGLIPRPFLHDSLWVSLKTPKFAKQIRPGKHFVEFNAGGIKFGYVVATVYKGYVVVETFFLITMKGTPEGDRLGKLAPATPDKDGYNWAGCDRLSLIFNVRDDPTARRILEKAGCGHLFEHIDEKKSPRPEPTDVDPFLRMFGGDTIA